MSREYKIQRGGLIAFAVWTAGVVLTGCASVGEAPKGPAEPESSVTSVPALTNPEVLEPYLCGSFAAAQAGISGAMYLMGNEGASPDELAPSLLVAQRLLSALETDADGEVAAAARPAAEFAAALTAWDQFATPEWEEISSDIDLACVNAGALPTRSGEGG